MSGTRVAWVILVWVWLQTLPVLACRYNVRDTGFVDLGAEPYHLYVFHRQSTSADLVTVAREIATSSLAGSNLAADFIDLDETKEHAGLKYLPQEAARTLPAAVLVSPDGQSLPVTLFQNGVSLDKGLTAGLDALITSPTREACLQGVCEAFAVVLLIEGESQEANRRAHQALTESFQEIANQMKLMPKAIAQPPVQVVLEAAALARERVLLWSLGLDAKPTEFPRAAVLYGRARWVGPLMKGAEITARNLSGLLSIIGADCECGLDISWTQGTRLPVRWSEARHARVAKALGFDPENPIVKLEVGRILGRRGSVPAAGMGYQEVSLDAGVPSPPAPATMAGAPAALAGNGRQPSNVNPSAPAETATIVSASLPVLFGLAAVAFGAGLFILVRSRKGKPE